MFINNIISIIRFYKIFIGTWIIGTWIIVGVLGYFIFVRPERLRRNNLNLKKNSNESDLK